MSDKATVLAAATRDDHIIFTVALSKAVTQVNELSLTFVPIDLGSFENSKITCGTNTMLVKRGSRTLV